MYVIGANATGTDPAGVMYFGNSMIVSPTAESSPGSSHSWVIARLDPATAMSSLTPGSSVPQVFDHLADRNLDLLRKHRDLLEGPGATPFAHKAPEGELVDDGLMPRTLGGR